MTDSLTLVTDSLTLVCFTMIAGTILNEVIPPQSEHFFLISSRVVNLGVVEVVGDGLVADDVFLDRIVMRHDANFNVVDS